MQSCQRLCWHRTSSSLQHPAQHTKSVPDESHALRPALPVSCLSAFPRPSGSAKGMKAECTIHMQAVPRPGIAKQKTAINNRKQRRDVQSSIAAHQVIQISEASRHAQQSNHHTETQYHQWKAHFADADPTLRPGKRFPSNVPCSAAVGHHCPDAGRNRHPRGTAKQSTDGRGVS